MLDNLDDILVAIRTPAQCRQACASVRDLSATESVDERRRLSACIDPLIDVAIGAGDARRPAAQALVNLAQNIPEHAEVVFRRLLDANVFTDDTAPSAVRALLFSCIRCSTSCIDLLLTADAGRAAMNVVLTVDTDAELQWAMLSVQCITRAGHAGRLPPARVAVEVIDQLIEDDASSLSRDAIRGISDFVVALLTDWHDAFGARLLGRTGDIDEDDLDRLYAGLDLANTFVICRTCLGIIPGRNVADVALSLLAACGNDDGPKPRRRPDDDEQRSPMSMKCTLVRLLANLCAVDGDARTRVGEDDALMLLLNQVRALHLALWIV